MKKICKSFLLLLFSLAFIQLYAQEKRAVQIVEQEESIYKYIDNYIDWVPHITDSLIVAVDYAIAFAKDSTTKSHIAGYLFNRFSTSTIMGDETIAIYISKNYFLNGVLPWFGEGGLALLKLYTDFNENSLIGMKAPELNLTTANGNSLSLTSLNKRYTVIYFFDNNCKSCLENLSELKEIINKYSHLSLDVYAVNTQGDSSSLYEFKRKNFYKEDLNNWHFVYDPLMESNFHKLYNVLITPRLYLLNRDKEIIGRSLTNKSLKELLAQEQNTISESYSLAEEFIGQYLSIFDLKDSTERDDAFEPLFNRLSKDNLDMYNAVFYQLFEHLSAQEEQHMKESALLIAQNYILPYNNLWFDRWFIETRVPTIVAKIRNNSVGAKLLSPTLFTHKDKAATLIQKRDKYNFIYFFNFDCSTCKPFSYELKKIFKQLKREKVNITAIYTGTDINELKKYLKENKPPWRVLFSGSNPQIPLHEMFETEYLPQTYLLDRDGIIIAKGINTIKLLELSSQ